MFHKVRIAKSRKEIYQILVHSCSWSCLYKSEITIGSLRKKVDAIYIYNTNLLWFNWASTAKLGSEIVSNSEKIRRKYKNQEKSEYGTKIKRNQKIRRNSERTSNFRNFPYFSEHLATLGWMDVNFYSIHFNTPFRSGFTKPMIWSKWT